MKLAQNTTQNEKAPLKCKGCFEVKDSWWPQDKTDKESGQTVLGNILFTLKVRKIKKRKDSCKFNAIKAVFR